MTFPPCNPEDTPVANLVELGKLGCLVGDGGIGKSRLVEQLAAGLATGELWGAKLPRTYSVLVVATEDDPRDIQESVLAVAGVPHPRVAVHVPAGEVAVDLLARLAQETGAEVIFINSLIDALCIEDENSNSEMAERLKPFKDFCLTKRVSITFVHHTNKGEGRTGRNRSRGASAIYDQCALFMELLCEERDKRWTLVFEKRRGGKRRERLGFCTTGTHFALTEVVPPSNPTRDDVTRLHDHLRAIPDQWVSTAELTNLLTVGRSARYDRLTTLRTRLGVEYDTRGRRYRYVAPDDPGAPPHTDADAPRNARELRVS